MEKDTLLVIKKKKIVGEIEGEMLKNMAGELYFDLSNYAKIGTIKEKTLLYSIGLKKFLRTNDLDYSYTRQETRSRISMRRDGIYCVWVSVIEAEKKFIDQRDLLVYCL